jgi:hypothetical protein
LLAEFEAGTRRRPEVPEVVATCLTTTVDGLWVVWAHKLAGRSGDRFRPLFGGTPYPADAVAGCRRGGHHQAPQSDCTCGFHAVSSPWRNLLPWATVRMEVALSGRMLAFEWRNDGVLFRAEHQTVVRINTVPVADIADVADRMRAVAGPSSRNEPPADPSGHPSRRCPVTPAGDGPVRLQLPSAAPPRISVRDDAGFCALVFAEVRPDAPVKVPARNADERTYTVAAV